MGVSGYGWWGSFGNLLFRHFILIDSFLSRLPDKFMILHINSVQMHLKNIGGLTQVGWVKKLGVYMINLVNSWGKRC